MIPMTTKMDVLRYKYNVPAERGMMVRHDGRLAEVRGCVDINELVIKFAGSDELAAVNPHDVDYHWEQNPHGLTEVLLALCLRGAA